MQPNGASRVERSARRVLLFHRGCPNVSIALTFFIGHSFRGLQTTDESMGMKTLAVSAKEPSDPRATAGGIVVRIKVTYWLAKSLLSGVDPDKNAWNAKNMKALNILL